MIIIIISDSEHDCGSTDRIERVVAAKEQSKTENTKIMRIIYKLYHILSLGHILFILISNRYISTDW